MHTFFHSLCAHLCAYLLLVRACNQGNGAGRSFRLGDYLAAGGGWEPVLGSSGPAGEFWLQRSAPRRPGPLAGRLAAPLQHRWRWKQGRVSESCQSFLVCEGFVCCSTLCALIESVRHRTYKQLRNDISLLLWTAWWRKKCEWHSDGIFMCGRYCWGHKHTLTVHVEPTDYCILLALNSKTKHFLESPVEYDFLFASQWTFVILFALLFVCTCGKIWQHLTFFKCINILRRH